ncbi:MAG: ribosome hibernation-promoting factor, HPF/YfiA family [Chloroflexota bacterium]|jgi:putative sigma-54 modulation protein
MELIVRTQHGHLSPATRTRIDEKLAVLQRYLSPIRTITVDVSQKDKHHRVQLTLSGDNGILLRAEERAQELMLAIDEAVSSLRRQIERYKGKHWRNKQRHDDSPSMAEVADVVSNATTIVRTKSFNIKPMADEEALEQMELLGHSFFVYRDHDLQVRVLYRRADGRYGVIVTA